MPSVRVKRERAQYATLKDEPTESPTIPAPNRRRSRTLTSLFTPPDTHAPASPQRNRAESVSYPAPGASPENQGLNPYRTITRRGSRVADHVMRGSVRSSRAPSFRDSASTSGQPVGASPTTHEENYQRDSAGNYLIEGEQETIAVPQDPLHSRVGSALSLQSHEAEHGTHHEDDIVDHLDVIDPAIATVSNLTNTANAIVIPPMSFYSRKPVVVLPKARPRTLEDGSTADDNQLDRHIEDVLTRKQQFKRIMHGVWAFLKTPMGIVMGFYGFNVIIWGAGIVLFLVKWIDLHDPVNQGYWVELCQQVETGLFTLTSVGLIPWRIVDTYRITMIWWYKRKTRNLRAKAGLPKLYDEDDLPDPKYDPNYVHVLTEKEQQELHYHQQQLMKSQTWYRPHGTETHRAFPINTALTIILLNDGNSIFQVGLSAVMWGLNRFTRPAATTATLLPAAFICGILSGVYIWLGSKKTRRTEKVEERLRIALNMELEREETTDVNGHGSSNPTKDAKATTEKEAVVRDYATSTPREPDHSDEKRPASPHVRIDDTITVPPHDIIHEKFPAAQ